MIACQWWQTLVAEVRMSGGGRRDRMRSVSSGIRRTLLAAVLYMAFLCIT